MLLLGAAVAAATLAGCGGRSSTGRAAATKAHPAQAEVSVTHPLRVVATVFPLAQLVSYVGGPDVKVTNLVPPGTQPQDLALSAKQRAEIASAQLVVEVGGGYQPEVEAAAAHRRHLALLPALSNKARPYELWLDPYMWSSAAGAVSKALSAASPSGKRQFENGARDFESLATSVASDYNSSLSTCPLRDFVTPDDAFGRMASAFSLVEIPLDTTGEKATLATIAQYSIPGVFSEQGIPSSALTQVASTYHLKVKSLDPMELTPAPGTKFQTYFAVMEANLQALEGPLECSTSSSYF